MKTMIIDITRSKEGRPKVLETEKVIIKEGLIYVYTDQFTDYHNLKYVELAQSIRVIHCCAFEGCSKLESINIPNIKRLEHRTFRDCQSLKKITLPSTVENIGAYAFFNCSSLTEIEIPKNCKRVNKYAFYGTNIKKVVLPAKCIYFKNSFPSDCIITREK